MAWVDMARRSLGIKDAQIRNRHAGLRNPVRALMGAGLNPTGSVVACRQDRRNRQRNSGPQTLARDRRAVGRGRRNATRAILGDRF
jgi:hypothetical protein